MKTIMIHRPEINNRPGFGRIIHNFYDHVRDVLKKHDIPFEELHKKNRDIRKDKTYNHIVYHTKKGAHNWLNVKMNYLNAFFYFDRKGYSGWSEIVDNTFDPKAIDPIAADAYFKKLQNRFVIPKNSKYAEGMPLILTPIPDGAIAIFLQVFSDKVLDLALTTSEEMVRETIKYANGRPVVIKRHPACRVAASAILAREATNWGPNVSVTKCEVHGILEKADTVVCMNSGTGFEALLHERHVITMAKSDYHHVSAALQPDETVANVFNRTRQSPQDIRKFVYWYLTTQVIDSEGETLEQQVLAKLHEKKWI